MALLKTLDEFKKYVRVSGSISADIILAAAPDAQEKYLRNILGDELLTDLEVWYNLETPTEIEPLSALLPYVQRALARFILVIASHELDVHLTDSGIAVVMNQNLAPASAERVKKYDTRNEERAWENIETLLRFLEANKADYPEWAESSAYTMHKRNLVNSAEEFDSVLNIGKSRLYFSRIRTLIDDADLLYIKPAISTGLFDVLLTEIKEGSVSAANAKILPYLQRSEVFYTAIESLDRTKYDGTGVQINLEFMQRDIASYTSKAEQYLNEARKIMDLTPNDYPEYRDSDQYVGLNTAGETDYSGFDNTATGNTIFVM